MGLERSQQLRGDQATKGTEASNKVASVGWIGEEEIYLLFRLYTQDLKLRSNSPMHLAQRRQVARNATD